MTARCFNDNFNMKFPVRDKHFLKIITLEDYDNFVVVVQSVRDSILVKD